MAEIERPSGGSGDPDPAHLDLPGPDDPVAWNYVEPGTPVVGSDGVKIGTVAQMLGTEGERIFHGIALDPAAGGTARVISADAVTGLTPSHVTVQVAAGEVDALEPWHPRP
jgi:hypothetical protein